MIRHDIICNNCKKIIKDVYFEAHTIKDSMVSGLDECKKCGKTDCFMIYWGSGKAPHVKTVTFVGDLWDKRGTLYPGDEGYNNAVIQDAKSKKRTSLGRGRRKGIND